MTITEQEWKKYIGMLRKLSDTVADKVKAYIERYGVEDTKLLIDYSYALVSQYGEGASALSALMYDVIAEAEGRYIEPAEPAPTATYGEVAKSVNGTLKTSNNPNEISGAVSRWVKMAGSDTTLKNAQRDGAQFAWIPSGDTCAFCLTLASRGWQYMSKSALKHGHAEHIHSHCDCQYAVRFDSKSTVAGYDPDKYRQMYENAEGDTPQEKINFMRRAQYEENKDEINAKKRAAYAQRNANNVLNYLAADGRIKSGKSDSYISLDSKNMYNSIDPLHERAEHVVPKEGFDDVFIHGDAYGVCYKDADEKEYPIPNDVFVEIIKQLDLKEEGIRLCACNTGAADDGIAQYVADKTGKIVLAPTKTLWISPVDPRTKIAKMEIAGKKDDEIDLEDKGYWRIFKPKETK